MIVLERRDLNPAVDRICSNTGNTDYPYKRMRLVKRLGDKK
jgi:hypothetical protein